MLRVEASRGSEDGIVAIVLVPEHHSPFPNLPLAWPLTGQEKQVHKLLVHGLSNIEIACILIVTENTVETHLRHIYEKLGVHTRNELLARFFKRLMDLSVPSHRRLVAIPNCFSPMLQTLQSKQIEWYCKKAVRSARKRDGIFSVGV